MENNETKETPKHKRLLIGVGLSFLGALPMIIFCYFLLTHLQSQIEEKDNLLRQEQSDQSSCVYKRDSLLREVKQLSIYKSLTKAMIVRDEATSLLKYKVGDIIYAKKDSAQGVISDIIIGGSKYDYYIKYKVLYKNNAMEDIIPELIY